MHRTPTLRLTLLLLLVLGAAACERRQHLVQQHLLEFGTIIEITLIADDLKRAEDLLGEIETRLRSYRAQWHAWEDSDLTRFNRQLQRDGEAPIPPSLEPLLELSRYYYRASDGLFDPALGDLIKATGFHGTAADEERAAVLRQRLPTLADLQIDGDIARSANPALQLDLGGIAKGYAIALLADYLDRNGVQNYIVNAGGDMQIAGNRFGKPWRIGIQNPFAPGVIAGIELDGRYSLFTSGNYQRRYRRGDQWLHHIIDPRSGEPSRGQSSATVLARDPVRADVAATVLMIAQQHKTANLALSLEIEDFLVVSDSRQLLVTRSFADKLDIGVNWPIKIVK